MGRNILGRRIKTEKVSKTYLFVSFLSHFWLTHFSHAPTLSIYVGRIKLHVFNYAIDNQGRSSHGDMRGPGIRCYFLDRSNCSHWRFQAVELPMIPNIYTDDQCEPIIIYNFIILMVVLQPCSPRCWQLVTSYCRTRCRQSQLRFVLSPQILPLRLLGVVPVGQSFFHVDAAS